MERTEQQQQHATSAQQQVFVMVTNATLRSTEREDATIMVAQTMLESTEEEKYIQTISGFDTGQDQN